MLAFTDQLWTDLQEKGVRFLLYAMRTKGSGFVIVGFFDNPRYEERVRDVLTPLKKKIAAMVNDSPAAKIILAKL